MKWLGRLAGTGKYLPWYRVTFALLPLATIIFFAMPSGLPEYAKIAWFAIAYLLYDVATTLEPGAYELDDHDPHRRRDSSGNALLKVKGVLMVVFAVVAGSRMAGDDQRVRRLVRSPQSPSAPRSWLSS